MQYNSAFRKLARFAPRLVVAEEDRIKRFLNGLRPIMQKDLSTSKFLTYAELLDTALKLEQGYNQLHAYHNQGDKKRPHPESQQQGQKSHGGNNKKRWNGDQKPAAKNSKRCTICGRDHEAKDCPQATGACFKCGKMGHKIANCPQVTTTPRVNQGQNRQRPPMPPQRTQGRVFALTNEDASNAHDVVKGSGKAPM